MKKLIAVFLTFTCFFALMLNLSGADPEKKWSWRNYVEYVTNNIEPFPTMDIEIILPTDDENIFSETLSVLTWGCNLLVFPLRVSLTLVHNIFVIIDGFLPFRLYDGSIGESGGGNDFGDFGGGGFGGGGGGIR